ncbi:hypothetical protein F8388_013059 [Cannabis sativa]|uniref:Uncharacterized protein n=1 Tax=Cannabis sativa TaxID=3483 RepID=A0A7J6EBD6_CANSA|nr:hypothetical protein F8388_013059 [Cannabis sativa]
MVAEPVGLSIVKHCRHVMGYKSKLLTAT